MDNSWFKKIFSRSAKLEAAKPVVPGTKAQADEGDAEVQFSMGVNCASGGVATQDYVRAAEWYRKAADQNHSLAQFNLGVMYAAGQGVAQDDVESGMWFDKAANQGDAGAQIKLAKRHYRASMKGLPDDACESRIEAYKWLHLASTQGYVDRQSTLVNLTLNMTREDVADGTRRAKAFVAGPAKLTKAQ
jgi:TPR repeat protein